MGIVKNSLFAIGLILGMTAALQRAEASLLIEPHIGYNLHSSTTYSSNTIDYNGAQYGARLGVQYFGLQGGLAYSHSTYTLETKPVSGATDKDDKKRDELGLFVGYKFPVFVRAWVGYNFSAKETQTNTNAISGSTKGDYSKGHSTEIGLGFTGFPIINVNLSYRMLSYDKSYDASTGQTTTLNPKFEPKEIVLGISAPFTLL